MGMPIADKQGRTLGSTAEAADLFGCSMSHIRGLVRAGLLQEFKFSARVCMYDLAEVRRLAKEHRAKRRKRGGRPPKGTQAA